jgi:hypothetical protein
LHEFSSRGIRDYTFDLDTSGNKPCADLFPTGSSSSSGNVPSTAATASPDVQPDVGALTRRFGGYNLGDGLTGVGHVIWSNGLLDPWHGGGFLAAPPGGDTEGNHWVMMPSGAHHLDLRGPDPADPADVTEARQYEEGVIRGWIDEYAIKSAALMEKA